MPKFFNRTGNTGGIFPDRSIEEDRSLFTNVDECGTFCTVADGDVPQPGPQECTPPDPYISPINFNDFPTP